MSIRLDIADAVAWVTIDRQDRRNAIDPQMAAALEATWQRIEADPSIRCAVLTGAGDKAFSAGADMKAEGPSGLEFWASQGETGFGGIALRRSLKIPVIARVNGVALGGGFEMVLGCDIVIACDEARFGLPEARVGRFPAGGGAVLLPRLMPRRLAMGLMMTGRLMDADEAARHGLVNQVVPRADLDATVAAWVGEIVACAPLSLAAIKAIAHQTAHLPPNDAQRAALPEVLAALDSEDEREGVAAFAEKRPPVWSGR